MPRKKRVKDSPASGPTALADVLEQSPVAEMIASHETQVEPALAETDGEEAVASFKRQRERELAVSELPPPYTEVIPFRAVHACATHDPACPNQPRMSRRVTPRNASPIAS